MSATNNAAGGEAFTPVGGMFGVGHGGDACGMTQCDAFTGGENPLWAHSCTVRIPYIAPPLPLMPYTEPKPKAYGKAYGCTTATIDTAPHDEEHFDDEEAEAELQEKAREWEEQDAAAALEALPPFAWHEVLGVPMTPSVHGKDRGGSGKNNKKAKKNDSACSAPPTIPPDLQGMSFPVMNPYLQCAKCLHPVDIWSCRMIGNKSACYTCPNCGTLHADFSQDLLFTRPELVDQFLGKADEFNYLSVAEGTQPTDEADAADGVVVPKADEVQASCKRLSHTQATRLANVRDRSHKRKRLLLSLSPMVRNMGMKDHHKTATPPKSATPLKKGPARAVKDVLDNGSELAKSCPQVRAKLVPMQVRVETAINDDAITFVPVALRREVEAVRKHIASMMNEAIACKDGDQLSFTLDEVHAVEAEFKEKVVAAEAFIKKMHKSWVDL